MNLGHSNQVTKYEERVMRYKIMILLAALLVATAGDQLIAQIDKAPDWVSSAVFYQIFPERFRNGDPSNDPAAADIIESDAQPPANWRIMPWTGDWYKLADWEAATGKDFYGTFWWRRYGGDLQGVVDKLDYLQELGITAIYFNPLFDAPSLHKYDQAMYHHIDKNFGPNPKLDQEIWASENFGDPQTWKWSSADSLFLKLIKECHHRSIHVIIDGVFNHVGLTFWAMQEVIKNQEKSAYKDWFKIKKWDDPATPQNEFEYAGWFGVKTLPELAQDENGLVPPVRDHLLAIVRRWMDPNGDGNPEDGVDGWRLDASEKVGLNFWREFRKHVRQINPQAYIVGEIWWEDWPNNKIFNPRPWLDGDAFDAVMNYHWTVAMKNFFIDRKNKIRPTSFVQRLAQNRQNENGRSAVMLNLVDSHDTDRLSSMVLNPDEWFDHRCNVRDNRDYQIRKPADAERAAQKLALVFQMTCIGVPSVYYGDEAGMWGGDDPDERKPMLWPDMQFEDEVVHPFGAPRPRDANKLDQGLFEFYKKVIAIRKSSAAFTTGGFHTLVADDQRQVLAYLRQAETAKAIVIFNNGATQQPVDVPLADAKGWRDVLNDTAVHANKEGIQVTLPAQSAVVLLQ
jgi:glycosidase